MSRFIAELGADVAVRDRKARNAPVSRDEGRARAANLLAMLGDKK